MNLNLGRVVRLWLLLTEIEEILFLSVFWVKRRSFKDCWSNSLCSDTVQELPKTRPKTNSPNLARSKFTLRHYLTKSYLVYGKLIQSCLTSPNLKFNPNLSNNLSSHFHSPPEFTVPNLTHLDPALIQLHLTWPSPYLTLTPLTGPNAL